MSIHKYYIKRMISKFYPSTTNGFPILLYHSIGKVKYDPYGLRVEKDKFYQQIKYIYDNFTPICKIEEIHKVEKPIIITFDDGFKDFLDAYEIMRRKNITPILFVSIGFLKGECKEASYTSNWGYLSEEDITHLSSSIEIGAHSWTHQDLTKVKDLTKEIIGSYEYLNKKMNITPGGFALPYGYFNHKVIKILEKSKYKYCYTSIAGFNILSKKNNISFLNRIEISGFDTMEDFINKLKGKYNWLRYFHKLKFFKR